MAVGSADICPEPGGGPVKKMFQKYLSRQFSDLKSWIAHDVTNQIPSWIEKILPAEPYPSYLAAILGIIIGLGAAEGLGISASKAVNLFPFLVLFAVLPSVTLIATVIGIWRMSFPIKYVLYLLLAGSGYGIGGLVSMVLLFFRAQVAVEMQTTFFELVNPSTAKWIVSHLALVWSPLGVQFSADAMIDGLGVGSQPIVMPQNLLLQWRNFLLLSIVTYSILPRAMLYAALIHSSKKLNRGKGKPSISRPFKIDLTVKSIQDFFTLAAEERRLLTSLQFHIVRADIEATVDLEVKREKFIWLGEWKISMESLLEFPVEGDRESLIVFFSKLSKQGYAKAGLILFECLLFEPYYQLSNRPGEKLGFDASIGQGFVKSAAIRSGLDHDALLRAVSSFRLRLKRLTGFGIVEIVSLAIGGAAVLGLAGWAIAPAIGLAIGGSMGLGGIAAEMAGLALLGGGATILGGFGIAGGMIVVAGGGAILGASAGGLCGVYLLESGSNLIANDIAKFEAVVFCLLGNRFGDPIALIREKIEALDVAIIAEIARLNVKSADGSRSKETSNALKEAERGRKIVAAYTKSPTVASKMAS
jgi:hypothetical protein